MTELSTTPTLLGERDGIWALYKPSGMLIHPAGTGQPDLLTWIRSNHALPRDLTPVHRLDLGTSGLVIAATARRAEVAAWFEAGEVEKTYQALVHGRTQRKGVIRRPLKDARREKTLSAVTRWRSIERLKGCTLLSVRPATGRKHQVRRHLHGIGHPVVGDARYRRPCKPVPGTSRLWLHAWRITLPDELHFEAELPLELKAHLEVLRGLDSGAGSG